MKRIHPKTSHISTRVAAATYFEIRPSNLLTRQEADGTWWAYTEIEGPKGLRVEGLVASGATATEALQRATSKDWRNSCAIRFKALPQKKTAP